MLKTQCNILPLHTEVHPVGVGAVAPHTLACQNKPKQAKQCKLDLLPSTENCDDKLRHKWLIFAD